MSAGRKHISDKKDWNTPPKYIKLIKEMFGDIDLDPCSNESSMVDAKTKYILPINGLIESWNYKRIFVNPPYGRNVENKTSIYDWILKGVETSKLGNEVLFLIPVATNTKHFKQLIFKHAKGICFLEDTRLKFWNNGKEDKKGAPMACCMIYFGSNYKRFSSVFSAVGKCFKISNKNDDTKH
jgi:hypothetical protein